MKMVIANIRDFGPSKKMPHDSEIFDGEGQVVMHTSMYCQEVQATRGEVQMKKGPPGGFYNGAATSMRQRWENALLVISALFAGSLWIKGARFEGFNPKPETTAIMCHRDQIHGRDKCRKVEE